MSERIAGTGSHQKPDTSPVRRGSKVNPNLLTPYSGNYNGSTSQTSFLAPSNHNEPNTTESIVEGLGLYLTNKSSERVGGLTKTSSYEPNQESIVQNLSNQSWKRLSSHHTPHSTTVGNMYIFGKSLKLFSPQSKLRQLCYKTLTYSWVNTTLLILLFLQTGLLAYRQWNPLHLHGYVSEGYNWADYVLIMINIIYTVEVVGKIISYGFADDHIMYEELGLDYPESEIKQFYFNPKYIRILLRSLGLYTSKASAANLRSRFGSKKSNNNSNNDTSKVSSESATGSGSGSGSDSDTGGEVNVEIDLQPTNTTKGRDDSNITNNSYSARLLDNEEDREHLEQVPVAESQQFKLKNTFILPKTNGGIDQLKLNRAYIRNSWHRIDLVSTVSFWISLFLSINHYDAQHHILLFRALSCLRILRLCNLTTGTTTILTACKTAIPQLIDVSIFIGFFWLVFGIIGVQSFKSSLTRHCVWTNPNDPTDIFINSQSYCGSYIGLDGNAQPYIFSNGIHSTSIKGFRCPMYSQCIEGQNPYAGTVNFDNILQSLEMVYVIISANTFSDIMYYTMDTDSMAACLFFIFAMFILTVWLMNVFIAVIVNSFHIQHNKETQEQLVPTSKRGILGFLFPSKDGSTYAERISKLKDQNIFLKYYYRSEFIFVILIFSDLIVQCLRNYTMSDIRRHSLYRIEAAFTVVFLVEIVARFLFHFPNFRLFFASRRNTFDLSLAIITGIIIIQPIKNKLGHAYYWLTIFQLLRFYRVVLASRITRNLWIKIMGNVRAICDLALFYFILLGLVSIILSRFFEGVVPEDEFDQVPFPMHTLPNVFVGLYVITSTENWTEILYAMTEYSKNPSSRAFSAIFLIAWFILSNSVIMNVFIAVIANTLEVSEEGKRRKQLIQFIDNMTSRLQTLQVETGWLGKFKRRVFKSSARRDELERAVVNLLLTGTAVSDFLEHEVESDSDNTSVGTSSSESMVEIDDSPVKSLPQTPVRRWIYVNYARIKNYFRNPFYSNDSRKLPISLENFDPANFARNILTERNALIVKQNRFLDRNPRFNYVFYIISPHHWIRRMSQRIVGPSYGDRIDGVNPYKRVSEIFTLVMFISTIALVVTACYLTPLYRKKQVELYGNFNWSFWLEVAFNVLFTMEFLIKVLADGLIFTPNGYMRSSWNLIDMLVLLSLWIELIAFLKDDGNLARFVRGLKALRALRLLTVSETAKANFHNTLISGFGKIINAGIISLCLLFPFSIWGLNIFEGRLGYCLDGQSPLSMCYNEYQNDVFNWNVVSPNVYTHPYLEFNQFGTAFATLFEIVSLEGWADLLQNLMNSTGVGTVPQTDASPFNGVFVILFNFISTIFILTLFVSVIISNYSKTTGRAYLTSDQISWYHVKKILLQVKPSKRKSTTNMSTIRRFCYRLTIEKNVYWTRFLNIILFIHVMALLLECYPSWMALDLFRKIAYTVAAGVFLIHYQMLFIAQGIHLFFKNKWNVFGYIVALGAVITTTKYIGIMDDSETEYVNINKLFLVGILTFVIPRSNRLNQLLRFASASLPTFLSLAFTWAVVFLVFAIAMNQIFGLTKIGPNGSGNINVRSVPKALIMLFRNSFGEGWNYIMQDYTVESPFCTTSPSIDNSDCGNKQFAYILFIAWNLLSMYIFLNMFVSLILDSFSYINHRSGYGDLIQREEIRKFKRTWQRFDPEGTGYIKPIQLPKLLHALDGALSFHFYSGILEIPVLCNQWFKRNDISNPYDVTPNYESIRNTLDCMDIPKIRERRKAYETFIEEALLTMELNNDPGISFTRILLQLPLYTSFEAGQCLNLIDFLERRLLVQRVEKRLHTKRVYETIASYACRWKYRQNQNLGIRDTNIGFDSALHRNSYLHNENLGVNLDPDNVSVDGYYAKSEVLDEDATGVNVEDEDDNNDDDDEKEQVAPELESESIPDLHPEGTYIPRSPIRTYTTTKKEPTPFLEVARGSSEMAGVHISPFLTQEEINEQEAHPDVSLMDLSRIDHKE
ncbi:Ion transport protein-domain-containing protein [Scheffersomyces amazonensis]|uniref:Ion transport protein-domain-containing protein n=1 Tax=Scheffersomyces amazonensis TaxID=1078765 RepID=UPI00315DEDEB